MDRYTFNELLISEVEKQRVIWDLRSNDYKNVVKKDQAWRTIAAALGESVPMVMKRWKSLRDTFMKKRKEVATPRSGAGAEATITVRWANFQQMSFLMDSIETSGNLSPIGMTPTAQDQRQSQAELLFESIYDDDRADVSPVQSEPSNAPPSNAPIPQHSVAPAPPSGTATINGSSSNNGRERTSATPKRKPADKPFEKEINMLSQMALKEADSAEHFGLVIADKLRQSPSRLRLQMEIELLQVAAKYLSTE